MFDGGELRNVLENQTRAALTAVERAAVDDVRFRPDDLTDSIVEAHSVNTLTIDWDSQTRGGVQSGNGYGGTMFTVEIFVTYAGEGNLFQYRASQFTLSGTPQVIWRDGQIRFVVAVSAPDPSQIEAQVRQMRADIDRHLGWTNTDIERWTPTLRPAVTSAVARRKKQLDDAATLDDALRIPVRGVGTESAKVTVPAARKTVRPSEKTPKQPTPRDEPRLDEAMYEDIVRTIQHVGINFERLPKTTGKWDEPELRDVLLFILNSNYEGAAGGELFNGAGKTDILIRHQDRNAFIGECKIWGGAKAFTDAIDQLLGYTVWRDTKAALIVFIRNKDATAAIEAADQAIRDHPDFVSAAPAASPDSRRDYVMHAKDDERRAIRLALLPIVVRAQDD